MKNVKKVMSSDFLFAHNSAAVWDISAPCTKSQ